MPSAAPAAVHAPQQHYSSSSASSQLGPALINTSRPILPLPKRRVPLSTTGTTTDSSSAAASSTTLPLPPPQIFTHTYPPATTRHITTYIHFPGDYESSESDDDLDETGSTTSSVGREDFNLKNKKKRKIPLSATNSGNFSTAVAEITSSAAMGRAGSTKGRLNGWRVPSATARTEGGYTRRKTRVASRSLSAEPHTEAENSNITYPVTPAKTAGEQTTTPHKDVYKSPAPSGPFSFSCPSPLSRPTGPPMPPMGPTSTPYTAHPSAPPTASLPVPPPPPPAVSGQENIPPQQPYPQNQQQQRLPPQGIKHPNSEKARRVAQLTKLRERYRMGPKPETDDIYICQFCTYGFIYGEEPRYLIRQYNRKRNAEIRLRRERRKMLEKARMKGKKGPLPAAPPPGGQQSPTKNEDDGEDDGLCCTCGQQVGQHNHVPPPGGTGNQQQPVHGHAPKGK